MFRKWTVSLVLLSAFGVAAAAAADKQYGPGVSNTEIKIGNIMPYSGPRQLTPPSAKRRRLTSRW